MIPSSEEIVESLRHHVVAVSGGTLSLDDVVPDVDVYDAGYVDSVGVTQFMLCVRDQYQVVIADSRLGTELKSLRDLATRIHAELDRAAGA
jgi:acyl carrier protein